MTAPDILRHAILGLWAAVLIGLFILRFNTKRLSPTFLRYMAYLGHTTPEILPDPPAKNTAAKSTSAR